MLLTNIKKIFIRYNILAIILFTKSKSLTIFARNNYYQWNNHFKNK